MKRLEILAGMAGLGVLALDAVVIVGIAMVIRVIII